MEPTNTTNPQAPPAPKPLPTKTYRAGAINLAVWPHLSHDNRVYQTITLERRYKNDQTGEWKSTTSLNVQDLPKAVMLLQKAYEDLTLTEHVRDHQTDDDGDAENEG